MGVVVGAAIVSDGRVLAARRTAPPEAAGRWELPGGKVEPGETRESALVREVAEELGCTVAVRRWLTGEHPAAGGRHRLQVAVVDLVGGTPDPREHDAVAWLGADELDAPDWLDSDRPFLDQLRPLLVRGEGPRGILHDEEDARAVAARLVRDGWEAAVVREPFAGEDDDEDHAWAVLTDAPVVALEVLVDAHDGWVDEAPAAAPGRPAGEPRGLPLPDGPRRTTRPG